MEKLNLILELNEAVSKSLRSFYIIGQPITYMLWAYLADNPKSLFMLNQLLLKAYSCKLFFFFCTCIYMFYLWTYASTSCRHFVWSAVVPIHCIPASLLILTLHLVLSLQWFLLPAFLGLHSANFLLHALSSPLIRCKVHCHVKVATHSVTSSIMVLFRIQSIDLSCSRTTNIYLSIFCFEMFILFISAFVAHHEN